MLDKFACLANIPLSLARLYAFSLFTFGNYFYYFAFSDFTFLFNLLWSFRRVRVDVPSTLADIIQGPAFWLWRQHTVDKLSELRGKRD
jgi:hypothetical protein